MFARRHEAEATLIMAYAAWVFFLFGLAAGFLMVRLRRLGARGSWEQRLLLPIAWVTMSAAFTLAGLLFAVALAAS